MIRIGKIVATHGLKGSLVLTHVAGSSGWLKKEAILMVEMTRGSMIPCFVTNCKAANDKEYIINIEDIDKVEQAKKLVTKHVYVDEAMLAAYARQSPLLWIGFKLTDKKLGEIGPIQDVVQTGYQWLAKVNYRNNEALLPLIEDMIIKLDLKSRTIKMDLPDGLLDIYVSK